MTALEYVAKMGRDVPDFRVDESPEATTKNAPAIVAPFLFFGDQQVPLHLLDRWAFIEAILDGEISFWKTYHAIAPSLTGYCNLITQAASKGRSGNAARRLDAAAADMRQALHRRHVQVSGNSSGVTALSFGDEVDQLIKKGYKPMLETLLPTADSAMRAGIERLVATEFSDVMQRRKDIKAVVQSLGTLVRSPESLQDDEHLRNFLNARRSAMVAALAFTNALLFADHLLDVRDSGKGILPAAYPHSAELLDELSFEAGKDAWTAVIRTANAVIVAAVDIMRDVRPDSTLVK